MRPATVLSVALFLSGASALAAEPEGRCEVKVSGGAEFAYTGKGGQQAVASDHWYTEEELRKAIEASHRVFTKDPVKLKAKVDEDMKNGGTLVGPLVLNCVSVEGTTAGNLNILPVKNTRATLPMKPGKYKLVSMTKAPKELKVSFRANDVFYVLSGPGELVLSKFDASGVAGTFKFSAKSHPLASKQGTTAHTVQVVGNFDFPCTANTRMCQGT